MDWSKFISSLAGGRARTESDILYLSFHFPDFLPAAAYWALIGPEKGSRGQLWARLNATNWTPSHSAEIKCPVPLSMALNTIC